MKAWLLQPRLAWFALLACPAAGSAEVQQLADEVQVTASRLATPAIGELYRVESISPEQLAGRQGVGDALSRSADIYLQQPGGRSGMASVFLRGADPNFTTVLLDGVALNDSTNSRGGAVNVAAIDAGALQRIDLVVGPMSSLYGSGALAGAINLVVPGGSRSPELRGTVTGGSSSDYAGTLLFTGPLTREYGGSLSLTGSDDGDISPGAQFRSWAVTGKLAPLDGGTQRLILRMSGSSADAFPDSSGGPRLAVRRTLQTIGGHEALLGLEQRLLSRGALSLDLSGSYLDRRDATRNPGVAPSPFDAGGLPATLDSSSYRRGLLQALARHALGNWRMAGGVELQREVGRSDAQLSYFGRQLPAAFDATRDTVSGFTESTYRTPRWVMDMALRADHMEPLGTHVSARVGARYLLNTRLALRFTAGTGFKAPSFYALGNPLVGNPLLRPERSGTGELGLLWSGHGGLETSLSLFHSRFTDLIDFDPGPPPRLLNRSEVISQGVAATLALPLVRHLKLNLQTQYAATEDSGGQQLLDRPRWRVSAGANWTDGRLSLDLQDSLVSDRDDYSIPTGVRTLAAYQLVTAELALILSPSTRVRLVIDNALDRHYEDAVGFPAPRSRARLSITHRLHPAQ